MSDYIRNCPICNKEIHYKKKEAKTRASKKNSACLTCCKIGEKNPFYNKTHTEETIDRIKKTSIESDKRKSFWERQKTKEFREKLSETLKIVKPNQGKGYYKAWVKKYGKEIADIKNAELSKIKSEKNKGKLLGVPPKHGIACGNGWSGWYKDYFFRSLGELSFIIKVIERFKFDGKTAENKKYKVQYFFENNEKYYFPDFILNEKYVIECKPKRLQNINLNIIKFNAAKEKFTKEGLKFKVFDVVILTKDELSLLYGENKIKWSKTTQKKFEKFYKIPTQHS